MNDKSSFDLFLSESAELENAVKKISKNADRSLSEIVDVYYKVIIVRTLGKDLIEQFTENMTPENKKFLTKIDKIYNQQIIEFNTSLHPEIFSQLKNSIQIFTDNLKLLGQNSEQKTKETIEKEALLYKELRELMSTKEFVEQYNSGIKDD